MCWSYNLEGIELKVQTRDQEATVALTCLLTRLEIRHCELLQKTSVTPLLTEHQKTANSSKKIAPSHFYLPNLVQECLVDVTMHGCNPSTQEVEAGGWRV
jgi:hypothetical protein